jgi:hypothetical protein
MPAQIPSSEHLPATLVTGRGKQAGMAASLVSSFEFGVLSLQLDESLPPFKDHVQTQKPIIIIAMAEPKGL